MAHVDRERGQLILVTGLAIALAMVALVLLLNTAIFTENLASRGADQSGREAVEYQRVVIDGIGDLIDSENEREHSDWSDVKGNVTHSIEEIDNRTARSYAIGGTVVQTNLTSGSPHDGRLIRQTSNQSFESGGGTPASDWDMANSVEGTRSFTMTVNRSSLEVTNESEADASGAFRIEVDGNSWKSYIYRNRSDTDNVTIASNAPGSATAHCRVDRGNVTIDFTAGTVDNEPCPGLVLAKGVSPPYDIDFRNGNNASGRYELTVNTTSTPDLNYGGPSPYYVPAVYSVALNLTYESPTLTYRTRVRVAPGEPE